MKVSKTLLAALSLLILAPAALAQESRSYSGAEVAEFEKSGCHLNICTGNTVQVVIGRFQGHTGTVLALDPYRDTVTVLTLSNVTVYARFSEVRVVNNPVNPRCYWNLCVGDSVQIVAGPGAGQVGRVESLNPQVATVGVVTNFGGRFFPNVVNVRKITSPQPNCYAQICIGYRVQAISGRYRGHAGIVVAIQPNGVLSVRAPNGVVGFPTAFEVRRF